MAKETFLTIKDGKVELYNTSGQRIKTYYTKGDAARVDWLDKDKESIEVMLESGKILLINKSCQITKRI